MLARHCLSFLNRPFAHTISRLIASESSFKEEFGEYQRWKKGGGMVHRLASVDATVVVEIGAFIHAHAKVGCNTRIGSGSVIGPDVTIGSSTLLRYNTSLQNCVIGNSCTIHNGACIGQDGFGFFVDGEEQMIKKTQTMNVRIEDHVEIGATTCIDRGSWRDTIIGRHTKIDNQVQIGHNVVIGQCCMLCGQVGIGGSCTIGDYVVLGGKAGVADHVSIASKVRIAAMSGVTCNITEKGDYAGFPAVQAELWRKSTVAFRKQCLNK